MARLFVALRLPPALQETLSEQRPEVRGVRWIPQNDLHLTLAFLPAGDADQVSRALKKVESPPIAMALEKVRLFPSARNARVLVATISPTAELRTLNLRIGSALAGFGISTEKRRFRPHISLARCKDADPRSLKQLQRDLMLPPVSVIANAFHLYESILKPDRAKHFLLESFSLTT